MNLEQFAKIAGVTLVDVGPEFGGRIGYKTADAPNCTICGFRTASGAYKGWLECTFGKRAARAVLKLLKASEPVGAVVLAEGVRG